ncbi:MAG: phytoene desaturase [Armatimonadetes bacterium]|nr:phytoene desaturase [Armatimonadota bacterium]
MSKPIVIVGAGLGGLALAARLAHRGENVLVLEKTDQIGGRNRRVEFGGCSFDGGPTLLMMLDPFERLFADLGEKMSDHVEIALCDPSYRAYFRDGTRIDATANVARMIRQIEAIGADDDALRYPKFIGELAALYEASVPNFVRKNYDGIWKTLVNPKALALVLRHHMLGSLGGRISKLFTDERLRMLFSFQTMYLGLSPFNAPWVYATLTYMEYGSGVWYPKGGLPAISEAVARLAQSRGAEIRLNSAVASIQRDSVKLESGEVIEAKAVVSNADLPYAEASLMRKPSKPRRYSCSALVLYIKYRGETPLNHHSVFFGADFKQNLDDIFDRHQLPKDPAFYVCASCKTEPERAPAGYENLFILVPCSNLDAPFTEKEKEFLSQAAITRLTEEVGLNPDLIEEMRSYGPNEWQGELNLDKGAAFGLSHDLFQSAFFRPKNVKDGVYFVGASTVPGNGLPMVLISAELAEQRLASASLLG